MADILNILNSLSTEKRVLLEKRLRENGSQYNIFPLSFAQQRMWFINQMNPESTAYNIPAAVELTGALNLEALERSINEIINRHEILRTVFRVFDSLPMQIILPFTPKKLKVTDLSGISYSEGKNAALRLIENEKEHAFDLVAGPLFLSHLYKIADGKYILFLLMHHIITDGWSIDIFIRELGILYEAFINNLPADLPPLPVQYADFAVWQKKWMEGEVKHKQLDYWKKKLSELPAPLRLPGETALGKSHREECTERSLFLPERYLAEIKKLSALGGTTNYMVFLAILQVLLFRHTRQNDFCIGTPVANRNRSEIEGLIGFFVNTLVLRSVIDEEQTFQEYLREVRKTSVEAYANQDLPFEKLVEELYPGRDKNNSPFFKIMYVHGSNLHSGLELSGVKISPLEIKSEKTKYDLTFTVAEDHGNGLTVTFTYMSDLVPDQSIDYLLRHFHVLLDEVISNPSKKIRDLSIMTEEELNKIIFSWNDRYYGIKSDKEPFPRTFERQARLVPENLAVSANGRHLTYAELNSRSNRLARFLIKKGVAPESMVGICTARSVDMIVAIIAVMKAGGAYLPLDPFYPKDRFSYILEDAGARILITEESLLKELPESSCKLICIDSDWVEISKESDLNPEVMVDMQNAAYVIYTSGSTGKPKGSIIQYGSLCNLHNILEHCFLSGYTREKFRVSLNTTIMFDASVVQLLFLLSGHSLYIVPEEIRKDIHELANFVRENKLDVLDSVTGILRILIEEKLFEGEGKPRMVLTGGEAFDEVTWRKLGRIQGTEFCNMYGPTECTVEAAMCRVSLHPESPSIGRSLPNAPVYILDRNFHPVPVGTPGELFIGGIAVGRGYLKRPEMTAEKFIPDPFASGGRLYRTGDLVRYNFDGTIDYLGRLDHQVKMRGFRIELGEIESVIRKFPAVKEAVVALRENGNGKYLCGYLVPKNGSGLNMAEIREFLKKELPEYMLPSAFMTMNTIPLTPNGKIDRKSLPEPRAEDPESKIRLLAPQTATEEMVCGVMAGVLNRKEVGVNESFFDIGGHSLLAAQVIYRLREIFRIKLQLKEIFDFPSARALAERIEKARKSSAGIFQEPISRASREENLALSFAQERLWFLSQLSPESTAYNVPEALRISGKISPEMLQESFNIIARRHEILRTVFITLEGKPFQKIMPEFKVPLPVIEALGLSPEEQERFIEEFISKEVDKPFLLDTLPLFRAILIRLSEEESVLILTFHHIITDGWSSRKLFNELMNNYSYLERGEKPAFCELPVQYADYASWQRQNFTGENLKRHIEYWRGKLKDSPQFLELPVDRPRPHVQSYNGSFISFLLSKEVSDSVKKIDRNYGVTLFMSLLSVFQVLLFRYSRQNDILIGTPIANRNRGDIEDLIGFFVNILVLRVHVTDGMKFSDLLRQTKETALEAYTYQDLPFEMLLDALQLERSMSYTPLFQVMFSAENMQTDENIEDNSIVVQQLEIPANTSKYDISLSAVEEKDGLRLAFEYNTDLFDKETMERMFRHYERILESIIDNPELRIRDIGLLSKEEEKNAIEALTGNLKCNSLASDRLSPLLLKEHSTKEIFRRWNSMESEESSPKLFSEIFEEQAAKSPDEIAVVTEAGSLTYSELNKRANKLARYLRRKGAGPDAITGILLGRNPNLITSILGIMKSGGGYLPLDPVYPKGRIEYILKDAGVRTLITEEALIKELPALSCEIILIDRDWDLIKLEEDDNLEADISPENIAYVIYTSGSTGKPKGSVIQHRSLYNYYRITGGLYSKYIRSGPVKVAMNTTIMFDGSILQLMFLLFGHTLYLPPENIRRDGLSLAEYIYNNRIDILDCVPALLRAFMSGGLFNKSSWKPKLVITGGEALDEALWKELCSVEKTDFFNAYGPTECTVDAAICRLKDYPEKVTIGKPPLNVRIFILDGALNLLPIGAIGELFIGGISVGRGYLNRPELTAEKFIPDAFSDIEGSRLYRTGDLARYKPDGTIEFMGRSDNQVKLRGFRIELGEIEEVLMQHEMVNSAAVILKERKGRKYIASYVTLRDTSTGSLDKAHSDEIREFLKKQLPEYMIPTSIIILKEMPLQPSGKIDRRALPEEVKGSTPEEELVPKSVKEKILLEVWKEVLGVEKISLNDNFFEIGGDSILAIQVVARAREKGIKIQPLNLFQHQTIPELALQVSDSSEENPNEEDYSDAGIELTPVQQSFFEQDPEQRNHWNQSVFFETSDRVDLQALKEIIKSVIRHHDILRSVFISEGGRWKMRVKAMEEDLPLDYFDLTELSPEQVKPETESKILDAQGSLNIENGPVIKFAYFKLSEPGKDKLLIAAHHLVIDVVSWRILLEDILTAYSQVRQNEPVLLPPKTTSYKKWSEFLGKYSRSVESGKEAEYWLKQAYYKWTPILRDYPDEKGREKDSLEVTASLNNADTLFLTHEAPKMLHANLPEVLLTALVRAYSFWSEKRTLMVDMEGHGREVLFENCDLSRTVGWFTSIYPVLLDLKTSVYPLEALTEVKEQLRGVPHHGIGFGILKYLSDDGQVREKLNSLPQSEISFNYLGLLNQFVEEENQVFRPVDNNKVHDRGPLNSLRYLIDIICFVSGERFQMQMRYSRKVFRSDRIQRLSELFIEELKLILESCKNGNVEITGSDFPLAQLNREKFDKVLNRLNKKTSRA
ncbi:MAG: amino acid adenylation domain-containing protein [Ignavibacteria bacterium]|nr:amino acid adenylation domain-containing protein [Ignavibacteria bacterium]MCU7501434.1 amino acid adenylation domain-containing protein [Ignavibacteria bacterium]